MDMGPVELHLQNTGLIYKNALNMTVNPNKCCIDIPYVQCDIYLQYVGILFIGAVWQQASSGEPAVLQQL